MSSSYYPKYKRLYEAARLENPQREWARCSVKSAKWRAKKKGIEHTITLEDVLPLTHDNCPVFGFPLDYNNRKLSFNSPTIDRLDNDKGYVPGNIDVISRKANSMKGAGTITDLLQIVAYLKQKGFE